MKLIWVYILFHFGIIQRLLDHNNGKSEYTKHKAPWVLVFFTSFNTKTEALAKINSLINIH